CAAERFFFTRRKKQSRVRVLLFEDLEDVRQRVVRHVDDVSTPGCVRAGTNAGGPRHDSPRIRADRSHRPPSTTSVTPFTYDAASDTRYSAAFAMSSVVPIRPSGHCFSAAARDLSFVNRFTPSVPSIGPGAIPFTRMPCG